MLYVGINLVPEPKGMEWPIDALVVAETLEAAQQKLEESDPSVRGWMEKNVQSYDYLALRDRGVAIIYEVDDD